MSETVRLVFRRANDTEVEVEGAIGDTMLRAAQAAGLPLEGTCEGQMACSTCHVVVDPEWFDRLEAASEEEEDMLDLAAGVRRTSRLSCQIELQADLDGLTASIPEESHDARRF
ncbi:MAG: 2Fe-2S iron-sulfur cluster-binding protein [Pseudomonadota bacterium]|jgi:ferredoxin|nr:2Fe-2S iron-sulfur cluster-binding protein [Pseudomonadota bacterium]